MASVTVLDPQLGATVLHSGVLTGRWTAFYRSKAVGRDTLVAVLYTVSKVCTRVLVPPRRLWALHLHSRTGPRSSFPPDLAPHAMPQRTATDALLRRLPWDRVTPLADVLVIRLKCLCISRKFAPASMVPGTQHAV